MDTSKAPTSSKYAVSRSRGKQPGESQLTARLREKRKAIGKAKESDESEPEVDLESGAIILHHMFARKVIAYPDKTVVKTGKRIVLGEAKALEVAAKAEIPVPRVYSAQETAEGEQQIRMDRISGQSLDKLWPGLSTEQKKDIARQLRQIIEKMRTMPPPSHFIGACDGTEIRDTRIYFTYHAPPCRDEESFNEYLRSALFEHTPSLLREAFSRQFRTDHRIVLTHCDLAPRNIMVEDGKITGLLDWEDSGWYPEYWEYVKFFQRTAESDWKQYAEDIFPEVYHEELVHFMAISRWQDA